MSPCPACASDSGSLWACEPWRALQCRGCGCVWLDPAPAGPEMYNESYYEHWRMGDATYRMKFRTSMLALRHVPARTGKLLDIGCAHGFLLDAARRRGFDPYGVEISPAAEAARGMGFPVVARLEDLETDGFQVVTMIDVIEHIERPEPFLRQVRARMAPGAWILLVTPDVSSTAARLLRTRWPHYKREHVGYYGPRSIGRLLARAGFKLEHTAVASKSLSPEYILDHFVRYSPHSLPTRILSLAFRLLPRGIRTQPLTFPSEMLCVARLPHPPSVR